MVHGREIAHPLFPSRQGARFSHVGRNQEKPLLGLLRSRSHSGMVTFAGAAREVGAG
jgi:hypothetical protein